MVVDIDRLHGGASLGDLLPRLERVVAPLRIVPGWATVELDRAEHEVARAIDTVGEPRVEPARDDELLGARCRLIRVSDGRTVVLLEPSTEGRLAAALAYHGEGSVALYLLTDEHGVGRAREAGFTLSIAAAGPLGMERLVLGAPRFGPFLVLAGLDGEPAAI